MKNLSFNAIVAAALILPATLAFAESQTVNPAASASTATGRLDFTVVIPAVLYLQVGAGNGIGGVNNVTTDSLTFTVPATNIGDATVVNAGAGDGNLTNGAVTVRVFSNFGTNVSLNSSVSGQLINGSGDTIPWTQIAVAAAADPSPLLGFTNTGIAHPTFSATTGNGTATVLAAASKLVRQQGKWTFSYANANVVPAGTYGNTVLKNGRVTYTATQI
jgi:hypothetical protein